MYDDVSSSHDSSRPFGTHPASFITLPLKSGATYNFLVRWGDGTSHTITSYNQADITHEYDRDGIYTVVITGQIDAWGFVDNGYYGDAVKLIEIRQWGSLKLNTGGQWFEGCRSLSLISATDTPDHSEVTDYKYAFQYTNLSTVDFTDWDVSPATSFLNMFYSVPHFQGDLSTWDVSKGEDFEQMFRKSAAFTGAGLSGWDTSSATSLSDMFSHGTNFNEDISGWDVSSVTKMTRMFRWHLFFDQDLSGWDTSSVTECIGMFSYTEKFNANIGDWDTSSVTSFEGMFQGAAAFDHDLSRWSTSAMTECVDFGNPGCNPAEMVLEDCVELNHYTCPLERQPTYLDRYCNPHHAACEDLPEYNGTGHCQLKLGVCAALLNNPKEELPCIIP